jgi:hypothetical protein
LAKTQRQFSKAVALLILYAYQIGYEVSLGHAYRSPNESGRLGFKNSNHIRRLAIDLNLFLDGKYLETTEDHERLGAFWETLHPLARWGGEFGDGNHYSFEWEGVR